MLLVHCAASSTSADDDGNIPLPARGDGGEDAAIPDDGGVDALAPLPACDVMQPFGAPVRLPELDALAARASPHLSADELTIYFTTTSPTNSSDLSMASRTAKGAPFANERIMPQSTPMAENAPTVGADDLTLWFYSLRDGSADLFVAERNSAMLPFGLATAVPVVNGPSTIEATPYFRTAANELWFVSERPGSTLLDVYVSQKTGTKLTTPTRVAEVSSAGDEFSPQPSEDGLTLILGSDRVGTKGKEDIWISHRTSVTLPFDAPVPISELNSANDDQPGWLSADGCRIWFSSGRETNDARQQIFYAERPKPP